MIGGGFLQRRLFRWQLGTRPDDTFELADWLPREIYLFEAHMNGTVEALFDRDRVVWIDDDRLLCRKLVPLILELDRVVVAHFSL